MKSLRMLVPPIAALLIAASFSSCSKKGETEVSTAEPAENPAAVQETTVPEMASTPPAESPRPVASTSSKPQGGSTKSSPTRSPAIPAAETRTVLLPAGATFDIAITTPVSTSTSNVGDTIEGKLLHPITTVDGVVIAHEGALIRGEIAELTRASRAKNEEDRASVKFAFTSLETIDGEKTLSSTVTNAEGTMVAKSTGTRDALIISASTVAGAIIGKVAGKDTKSAVIGAVGGAVLGTGAVMAAKGHELEVPAGSKISLRVEKPITVVAK